MSLGVGWENRKALVIVSIALLRTMGIVVLYILRNGRKENSAICHYSYLHCHLNSRTYLTRNQAHYDTQECTQLVPQWISLNNRKRNVEDVALV